MSTTPTTGCCERCRIDGDFMGEAYCQESDCPNCHQEKAEWEERFNKEIEHPMLLSENLGSYAPNKIKDFIRSIESAAYQKGREDALPRAGSLRDNADGTCNCRPLMGSCFFTDAFGNRCGCKCHFPEAARQGKH